MSLITPVYEIDERGNWINVSWTMTTGDIGVSDQYLSFKKFRTIQVVMIDAANYGLGIQGSNDGDNWIELIATGGPFQEGGPFPVLLSPFFYEYTSRCRFIRPIAESPAENRSGFWKMTIHGMGRLR